MTKGVGGSTPGEELERLHAMAHPVESIRIEEYHARVAQAQKLMRGIGVEAIFVYAGANLSYYSGISWNPSERTVGAIIPAEGEIQFVAPWFELETIKDFMLTAGEIHTWHEHESPYRLLGEMLTQFGIDKGTIGLDENAPFSLYDGLAALYPEYTYINANAVTAVGRRQKSLAEISIMQSAKNLTLEVQKSAARILHAGITTTEVESFINQAHIASGALSGSAFCIVLFGVATSYPHGVRHPQVLQQDDWVLIDTGCRLEGYHSDITRTYAYGNPTPLQRRAWMVEKEAQAAAFDAATPGSSCEAVDEAARAVLQRRGFGPGYQLPGLPHRTGHGCGLEIHEWPYLVKGDQTLLDVGMVFSNEPMLVLPGEFGVRLEDHFYMTAEGPRWFTEPSYSIDDPFASAASA